MSKGFLFWVVYLIAIIVYGVLNWPVARRWGGDILIFILLGLLGWAVFGDMIK